MEVKLLKFSEPVDFPRDAMVMKCEIGLIASIHQMLGFTFSRISGNCCKGTIEPFFTIA